MTDNIRCKCRDCRRRESKRKYYEALIYYAGIDIEGFIMFSKLINYKGFKL